VFHDERRALELLTLVLSESSLVSVAEGNLLAKDEVGGGIPGDRPSEHHHYRRRGSRLRYGTRPVGALV
jgi:hypothetical protein